MSVAESPSSTSRPLEEPVTMSFDRGAEAADGWLAATFAALERLVRPTEASVSMNEHWWLRERDAEHHEQDGGDATEGTIERFYDRIDAAAISEVLREGGGAAPGSEWILSLSGWGRDEAPRPPDDEEAAPFEVEVFARPERIWLELQVWDARWADAQSASRTDVEDVGRALVDAGWQRRELDGWSHLASTPDRARVLDDSHMLMFHRAQLTAFEPLDRAMQAIEAVHALAPFFRPRVLELHTAFVGEKPSEEPSPGERYWLLEEGSGADILGAGSRIQRRFVATLDREAMRTFVGEALAPSRPGGLFGFVKAKRPIVWTHFTARDPFVRVPAFVPDVLCLLNADGELQVPVERRGGERWVCKPDDEGIYGEPMSVVADEDGLRLSIDVRWSLWAHRGTPGRTELDHAAAALERLGWKRGLAPE